MFRKNSLPESQKLIDDYAHLAEECCILSGKVFNSISEKGELSRSYGCMLFTKKTFRRYICHQTIQ